MRPKTRRNAVEEVGGAKDGNDSIALSFPRLEEILCKLPGMA